MADSMSRYVKIQIACASCGVIRGESNHWFVVTVPASTLFPVLYSVMALVPKRAPSGDDEYPACGESCLQKIESQLLSGKKLA